MNLLISISIVPVIALIFLCYFMDCYEPEPKKIVAKLFAFGLLMVIPCAVIEILLIGKSSFFERPHDLISLFINIFFYIGFVEEILKFIVVIAGVYRSPEFDEPYDGIIYTVSASLGFASLENLMYVISGGIGTGIARAVLSVPAHALFGVIMGYFLGISKFREKGKRLKYVLYGLFYAVLAHTIYDFLLLSHNLILLVCIVPFMAMLWLIAIKLVRIAQSMSFYKFNPQKEEILPKTDIKCFVCGFSVPSDAFFCLNCGKKVMDDDSESFRKESQ